MFGLDLNDLREGVRSVFDAQVRVWAGLAFMALAMVAIQYDEVVAPKVHGLSDGIGSVATDMSRRLSSFTL
jgi:hypothetical protein